MDKLILKRIYLREATVGVLTGNSIQVCTLELPNKQNAPNVSCIPAGLYKCKPIVSPSLGPCFDVQDVLGRTFIRIHKGNYTRQIQGCILVGTGIKDIDGDGVLDVMDSAKALDLMLGKLTNEFLLEIS